MAIEVRRERTFAEVAADGAVAAQAEITVGTVAQLIDLVVQREIDRAQLCVGMLRHRPFGEMLGVADTAGCCGGKPILDEKIDVVLFRRL